MSLVWTTIVFQLLWLAATAYLIWHIFSLTSQELIMFDSVLLIILVVCQIAEIYFAPREVMVDEEKLTIRLVGKNVFVKREDIVKVEPLPESERIVRTFGIGGVFGYIGWFKGNTIGRFRAYATDMNRAYVIYRKQQRPILVSVADAAVFFNL